MFGIQEGGGSIVLLKKSRFQTILIFTDSDGDSLGCVLMYSESAAACWEIGINLDSFQFTIIHFHSMEADPERGLGLLFVNLYPPPKGALGKNNFLLK